MVQNIVIALPERFGKGLHQRASQYGEAWKRIGKTFPELEIWLINSTEPYSYKRTSWNNCPPNKKINPTGDNAGLFFSKSDCPRG